jgi:ABC-2 type transport system ATP-binding protein
MSATDDRIVFDDVSKFYGEILGVNRVTLHVTPGITSLVGPNGSGKTTIMNLMTGLLRASRGRISVLGVSPDEPEALFRLIGYCAQFDSFPPGMTGFEFVASFLGMYGFARRDAVRLAEIAIDRVGLTEAMHRKAAGYSKGMRQRIRLAQSIAHRPRVLILDEPLNGLDPIARSEAIALFRSFAAEGLHLIISSHILHEVDMMSDRVVLLNNGYVVAEGGVRGMRDEMPEHPMQILVRCDQPASLAARLFERGLVVEAGAHDDGRGLLIRTKDADRFYSAIGEVVVSSGIQLDSIAPVDDDLTAVYQYLIGSGGGVS